MKSFSFSVLKSMKGFLALWSTQSLSALGSGITNFALILWSYQQEGSALTTALLAVCSYAPYVIMSILAGAISDRWNKKATMLICDLFAALCTVAVLLFLMAGKLEIWHLYLINALNGLMNTFQKPASEVASSLLAPKEHYQQVGALHALSSSLHSILTPLLAAALYSLGGLEGVILVDLFTFALAFFTLAFGIDTANTSAIFKCALEYNKL